LLTRITIISLIALVLPTQIYAQESGNTMAESEPNKLTLLSVARQSSDTAGELTSEVTKFNTQNPSIAKKKLKTLLNEISFFSADFSQKVVDEEANVIQQGQGHLVVSKPNLFRWQTNEPEETLIVSDGKTLWSFDPFIDQASAYTIDASIANTPILLLSSNDEKLWENYSVTQANPDTFLIHANDNNSRIKTLELNFNTQEKTQNSKLKLSGFSLLDSTGQLSVFKLTDFDRDTRPESALFNFILPEGVDLDDQR